MAADPIISNKGILTIWYNGLQIKETQVGIRESPLIYCNESIAHIGPNKTFKTLTCKDKLMKDNIELFSITINCKDMIMKGNLVIDFVPKYEDEPAYEINVINNISYVNIENIGSESWVNVTDIEKCRECNEFIQNLSKEEFEGEFGKFVSGLYFNISKIEKVDIELIVTNNEIFIETAEFYEYVDNYLHPIDWDYMGDGLYCIYTPNRNPLVITVRE